MSFWKSDDVFVGRLYPFPFGRAFSYKPIHQKPNVPFVSASHCVHFSSGISMYVFDVRESERGRVRHVPNEVTIIRENYSFTSKSVLHFGLSALNILIACLRAHPNPTPNHVLVRSTK